MGKKLWLLAISLFVFWIALTVNFGVYNLIVGIAFSLIVTLLSVYLVFHHIEKVGISGQQFVRFLLYIPFLYKEIVKANIDVASRVLSPKMPISPVIVNFKFPLKEPLPQITLANSITLTPGTLTVEIKDGVFYIHCLSEEHAADIFAGSLQEHVIKVYGAKKK